MALIVAGDSDTNSNLLDDDWERFFFGDLGVVGPYDSHPVNGYTYLQLFLLGADPRLDTVPSEPMLNVLPYPEVSMGMSANLCLQFDFPDHYFDEFEWEVWSSPDMQNFSLVAPTTISDLGGGSYKFDLGPAAPFAPRSFFKIVYSLK